MARAAGSLAVLFALGVLVAQPQLGCGPQVEPTDGDTVAEVLDHTLPGVFEPALVRFEARLGELGTAVDAWEAGGSRDDVRPVYVATMEAWQELEVMRFGPLGSSLSVEGGLDLRDEVYSWPLVNACLVDQKLVEGGFDDGWFDAHRPNAYGLDALERLLWGGRDNACPGQVPLNSEGTWDALDDDALDAARATMAGVLVDGLVDTTASIHAAFDDFDLDPARHGSEQEALNAVYDALFALETEVKDLKLAEPFGERTCSSACLELVESRGHSALSHRWLAVNLRAAHTLYLGGDGPGLHDILLAQGQDALASDLDAAFTDAIAAAEALDEPLDDLFERDASAALEILAQVRRVTDHLKDDVTVSLALVVPAEAGGDND